MGLDMFVFSREEDFAADVDFKPDFSEGCFSLSTGERYKGKDEELFYWRKHPNLHGWMNNLYERKGGSQFQWGSFNGATLRLTFKDLDLLEIDVEADALPPTEGFFFGESGPADKELDRGFIAKARAALKEGQFLYYYSSW